MNTQIMCNFMKYSCFTNLKWSLNTFQGGLILEIKKHLCHYSVVISTSFISGQMLSRLLIPLLNPEWLSISSVVCFSSPLFGSNTHCDVKLKTELVLVCSQSQCLNIANMPELIGEIVLAWISNSVVWKVGEQRRRQKFRIHVKKDLANTKQRRMVT